MSPDVYYLDEVLGCVKRWFENLSREGKFSYNPHVRALFNSLTVTGPPVTLAEAEEMLRGVVTLLSKLPPCDPTAVIANKLLRRAMSLKAAVSCARSREGFSLVDGKPRATVA